MLIIHEQACGRAHPGGSPIGPIKKQQSPAGNFADSMEGEMIISKMLPQFLVPGFRFFLRPCLAHEDPLRHDGDDGAEDEAVAHDRGEDGGH